MRLSDTCRTWKTSNRGGAHLGRASAAGWHTHSAPVQTRAGTIGLGCKGDGAGCSPWPPAGPDQMTCAIPRATASTLPLFSAATQMRPESTP